MIVKLDIEPQTGRDLVNILTEAKDKALALDGNDRGSLFLDLIDVIEQLEIEMKEGNDE